MSQGDGAGSPRRGDAKDERRELRTLRGCARRGLFSSATTYAGASVPRSTGNVRASLSILRETVRTHRLLPDKSRRRRCVGRDEAASPGPSCDFGVSKVARRVRWSILLMDVAKMLLAPVKGAYLARHSPVSHR